MTGIRRFWTETSVVQSETGFELRLDDRPVRTPGRHPLSIPTEALARAVAAEWEAQTERIDPRTMPLTRIANSAIEQVAPIRGRVATFLASYGETDLLCYRAEEPAELVRQQAEAWDPLIDWAEDLLGVRLIVTSGVMPVTQPRPAISAAEARFAALPSFRLAAIHDVVTLTGSAILGLAVEAGRIDSAIAWEISRIDENWQESQWGEDSEASRAAARKAGLVAAAGRVLDLTLR